MPLDSADLNDSAILGNTVLVADGKGNSQLKIALPDGKDLTSEFVPEDRLKGQVLIGWCETVRSEVANAAARAKRGAISVEPAAPGPAEPRKGATAPSALGYAQKMLQEAVARVELADSEAERWQREQAEARVERQNWKIIVETMSKETISE